MATVAEKQSVAVSPFGIQVDHPRNSDLLIQSIPGCRLRSAISAMRHVVDAKTKEPRIPLDQARHLATFPPTPGMELHVNPAKCEYTIVDPLHGNEELLERIRQRMAESAPFRTGSKLKGVPPQKGTLDPHRMKTLCREMLNIVDAGEAKVVKGVKPDVDDINDLPGHYLLNPGSRVGNTQPMFEKDYPAWVEGLGKSGG